MSADANDQSMSVAQKWIRPEIRELSAYHVPDASGLIKLDAMENPYSWPEQLVDQWLDALRGAAINRYPDPDARQLVSDLRDVYAIPQQAGILLGNGSDELIQLIAMAVTGAMSGAISGATSAAKRAIVTLDPGFSMYRMIATFTGMDYVGVPLRGDFTLDLERLLAAIETHQPAVIFIAYPNNPTGNLFELEDVRQVIDAAPGMVVVDEAYFAFAGTTVMPLLDQYKNLLVLRTLSKMGLAGLRLGFLAAAPDCIEELNKIRLPYNINTLTQISASFALQHHDIFEQQTTRLRKDRESLLATLGAHPSLTVYPSQANFILFRTPVGQADRIFDHLHEQGVLIKNLNKVGGVLIDCLRVTVGKAEENEAFLQALKSALADSVETSE